MQENLRPILDIQELDMKMIRLMRVKKERQKKLEQIQAIRKELHAQVSEKEQEITDLGKTIQNMELKVLLRFVFHLGRVPGYRCA